MRIERLIQLVGLTDLRRLGAKGWDRIYVSKTVERTLANNWSRALSPEKRAAVVAALVEAAAGETVILPTGRALDAHLRRLALRELAERLVAADPQMSDSAVARNAGVSRRTVARIRRELLA